MTEHELKTWPEWFAAVRNGSKTAEVRLDDRGYAAGDGLRLEEWDPTTREYTGRVEWRTITHVLRDHPGLAPGYVMLSLEGT